MLPKKFANDDDVNLIYGIGIGFIIIAAILYCYRRTRNRITLIKPSDLNGPYTKLGQGAFGVTYRCTYLGRDAAIKMIQDDKEGKEAHALVLLQQRKSPYIVKFYGIISVPHEVDGRTFMPLTGLVMEYMKGGDLRGFLGSWWIRSPSWVQKLRLAKQIVSGLQVVHNANLIHQDLKSENVLLDERKNAKLADFGISRYRRFRLAFGGRTIIASQANNFPGGTLPYIAPEVYNNSSAATSKSDIFSLGILIWEIATLKKPTERSNSDISQGKFTTVSNKSCAFFAPIIRNCIKFRPCDRPTASKVYTELEECNTKALEQGNAVCVLQ